MFNCYCFSAGVVVAATDVAVAVVVIVVSTLRRSCCFETATAKVGVAADVVVTGTAVSVLCVTTVQWYCWYYSAAVVVF